MSDEMYDVYLSFYGSDIREGFVKLLYAALDRGPILAFFDEESLRKGDHIPTTLSKVVTDSRIVIPIFSKNFAKSKWCLREVSLMVKSGVEIRPLFYGVSPTDLHCPDGSKYAEHLKKHESDRRVFTESILEWKGALETVANIPGWCSSAYSSDDDLIEDIVVEVRKILYSNDPHKEYLNVPECFGLNRSVKHVKGFLKADDHQQKMVKLGIHGMSGIGKTALAKIVFKELFSQFESVSFVASVGERCQEADGLRKLQTQMLKDVSHFRGEVGYVDEGKGLLQYFLRGKKVLLVLDDIQSFEQFDALGGNYSHFGAGSRLIITSQNEQILKVAKVDNLYRVRILSPKHASRLFKFHAFPDSYRPDKELETLCNDIISACEGHPRSLQISAKLLVGVENRDVWKEMVGKLSCELVKQKKLKDSYDALDRNEKEMFQDIACFVTWEKEKIAMIFWADLIRSPHACLSSLLRKSFVDLGPSNELQMHSLLRNLGRSIAGKMCTETPERTRLFDEEDVLDVLCRLREKAEHVRYLSNKPEKPMTFKAEMFKSLYYLRLLWLTDVAIEGHFSENSSLEGLRWLRLRKYSSKRLPQGMNLRNLVILEVTDSQITHLWDETEENLTTRPGKLKVVILRGCGSLKSLPGTLCRTPLQILDLQNCHSLRSLPDTMGSWTSLAILDMEGCSFSSLPQDFVKLANLEELNLSRCQQLSKLPANFGDLKNLRRLDLSDCVELRKLPVSFKELPLLKHLNLSGCSKLNLESDILENMTKLEYLNLSGCTQLKDLPYMEGCCISSLPQDFGKLPNLKELNLSCCQHFSKLPANFGDLKNLRRLDLSDCVELRKLPVSFKELTLLQHLNLNGCSKLTLESDILQNMTKLEYLNLNGCRQLEDLPHITNLASLTELCLLQTERLRELPVNIGQLIKLQKMSIGSDLLTSLPISIGDLSSLSSLHINYCHNLQFLPYSLGLLEDLEIMFE